jgi:hypothetical protein
MDNSCLNENSISLEQKKVLLKSVLDDITFNAIKNNPTEIKEAFDFNLANIIISTRGEF